MRSINHRALLSLALLFGCGTAAATTLSGTGLGQSWPNAADLSASPNFHAYRFEKQGVRYVQINDANGNVRGAVAYIDGQVLDLPIGVDASHWVVATDPAAPVTGETVYQDQSMTVHAAPQSDGTVRLLLAPGNCNGNPADCSMKGP
jgi:hypothetical protein